MLVKLPSGDQINPKAVTAVRILAGSTASADDTDHPALFVVTEYGNGGCVSIKADSPNEAEGIKEHIAELINAACHADRKR
jgi:hypothetical protein